MRKYLLLLTVTTAISFAGHTQSTDTICMEMSVARKVLIAAQQKPILDSQIAILNTRISGYEFAMSQLMAKDSVTRASLVKQAEYYESQKKAILESVSDLNKALRKEKRKRFWTGAAGMLTTGVMGYLLIRK